MTFFHFPMHVLVCAIRLSLSSSLGRNWKIRITMTQIRVLESVTHDLQ